MRKKGLSVIADWGLMFLPPGRRRRGRPAPGEDEAGPEGSGKRK